MKFFVDANVIVYAVTGGDAGDRCEQILAAVAQGEAQGLTSIAVIEEVWHLELSGRVRGLAGQARRSRDILSPLLAVTDDDLLSAFELEAPDELGANDRLHAAVCFNHGLELMVSADRAFDSIAGLRRFDPLGDEPLESLLAD